MSETITIRIHWGVSRGRNTEGWTVCSLYEGDTLKARCNGGGYDMKGTSLGSWIEKRFVDRLLRLKQSFYGLTFHDPDFDPGKVVVPGTGETVEEREASGKSFGLDRHQAFHSASSKLPTKQHRIPLLDGATGWGCMVDVLKAIGGEIKLIHEGNKDSIYLVTMGDMPEQKRKTAHVAKS